MEDYIKLLPDTIKAIKVNGKYNKTLFLRVCKICKDATYIHKSNSQLSPVCKACSLKIATKRAAEKRDLKGKKLAEKKKLKQQKEKELAKQKEIKAEAKKKAAREKLLKARKPKVSKAIPDSQKSKRIAMEKKRAAEHRKAEAKKAKREKVAKSRLSDEAMIKLWLKTNKPTKVKYDEGLLSSQVRSEVSLITF